MGYTVKVLFFASVRAQIGVKEIELKVTEGTTVGDVKDELIQRYPEAEDVLRAMLAAVNREFSDLDTAVPPGATIAFFPHVGGGSPPGEG